MESYNRDKQMNLPKERQDATNIDKIAKDHRLRYEFALKVLMEAGIKGDILDVGCGVGYGSYMLAPFFHTIHAVERSQEAFDIYKQAYTRPNILFELSPIDDASFANSYDAAVCFEFLEHIPNPNVLLKRIFTRTDLLIASVPNESVWPWKERLVYHYRHYTPRQFKELLICSGFKIQEMFTQISKRDPKVRPGQNGRYLIVIASK